MIPAAIAAFLRVALVPSQLAKGMNLFTMVFAIGQGVGPVAAGWIADRHGLDLAMLMGALSLLASAALATRQNLIRVNA